MENDSSANTAVSSYRRRFENSDKLKRNDAAGKERGRERDERGRCERFNEALFRTNNVPILIIYTSRKSAGNRYDERTRSAIYTPFLEGGWEEGGGGGGKNVSTQ